METSRVDNYDQYWNDRIGNRHFTFTKVHGKIIETVRETLGEKRARVLDCGVGPGHVFRELSRCYEVHGIELSKKAFELYDFDTSTIRVWDLNQGLPELAERMDLIIASRIIHHLDDPVGFIRSVRSHLVDRGWFLCVIPNICYYKHRLKFLFGSFPPISKMHVNFQTGPVFEQMVGGEGFILRNLTTPKKTIRAKLWPTVFSQDLIYVFQKSS